jgi:Tol biopolymer transport system component
LTLLTDDGGRVDWSPDGSQIAFDRLGEDGAWDLWLMDADGSNAECLSCEHPELPSGDMGQPAFHPGGEWLLFQAESPDHPQDNMPTHPGAGVYNDLVAMRLSDRAVFVVYDVDDVGGDEKGGTLHAVFSHDGQRLMWTDYERSCWSCPIGDWQVAIADWKVEEGVPGLENRENHQPGPETLWYETHGWGPDDSWVYMSAANEGQPILSSDILRLDLESGAFERITQTGGKPMGEFGAYDEHAKLSPDGQAMIWLNDESGIAEYWMANPDGSGRFQITDFNTEGHAHYEMAGGLHAVPSDNAWRPRVESGRAQALGFIQVDFDLFSNSSGQNYIVLMNFDVE